MKLSKIVDSTNVAEMLDDQELLSIGRQVVEEFEIDCESRHEWFMKMEDCFRIALQLADPKQWPWSGASNVQFPLLTIASLQFQARAYPSLIPADGQIVKSRVVGVQTDDKMEAAVRVSKHMSYQLMEEMYGWEEGMDKLLLALPIVGSMFKKTYYDPIDEANRSDIVFPKDLVVNYYAKCLDKATRITHRLELTKNDIHERKAAGLFLDVDLGSPTGLEYTPHSETVRLQGLYEPGYDKDSPYMILEQHRWLDLDEDGYQEPYIVTVHYETQKVLRIVPRFKTQDIIYATDGKTIKKIVPQHFFTKFAFIPNPDGGFYDLGFGVLLGPINHTVNTIINQLIDAGTLSNLQSGFLGRGVRLKGGDTTFKPGEWKTVNTTGDDLRKSIVPMPVREPSNVLFELLNMLVQAGKEISTISEIMVGKMPGQNTPATTTMAAIEQGMKVFTAIYKRIYRSLAEEFEKIFQLNKQYLPPYSEFTVLDEPQQGMTVTIDDYRNDQVRIIPGADASVATEQQRLAKAQALMEMFSVIPNKQEVIKRILEAQEQQGIDQLLQQPQPQGPSEAELEHQVEMTKLQIEQFKAQSKSVVEQAQAELFQMQARLAAAQSQMDAMQAQSDIDLANRKLQLEVAQTLHDALEGQQQKAIDQSQFNSQQAADMYKAQLQTAASLQKGAQAAALKTEA